MAVRNDIAEIEVCLLGCLLLREDAVIHCVPKLEVEDFAYEFHQKVFQVISSMYEEGERIDPVLVRRKLRCRAGQISELTDLVIVPNNYPIYLRQVQRDAEQRILARGLEDAALMAQEGAAGPAWQAVEDLRERLTRADDEMTYDSERLMLDTLGVAEAYVRGERAVLGCSTGWPSMDQVVGGLIPGNMWVVAARPGKGKSAFAANLLVNVAKLGERAALVSLEMSAQEIGMRLLCREAKVNWESLRDGKIQDAGKLMVDASNRLMHIPMTVIDQPRVSVGSLRAAVQQTKPAVIIVDYVQLMTGPTRNNREQEVAAVSRGLKLLAREEGVCVIALAQLNRNVEMRGEGASPQLSDLRDSGSLEQDPDIVAFLVPRHGTPWAAELDFEVAKNRNGMAKQVHLQWDKATVAITDPGAVPTAKPDKDTEAMPRLRPVVGGKDDWYH